MSKPHKYGATKSYRCGACGGAVTGDDTPCPACRSDAVLKFDSKREAARYDELRLLERAGKISNICLQEKFPIVIGGVKVCEVWADFTYTENGRLIREDVKGKDNRESMLKRKLVKAVHSVDFEIVR
jgi:hypothetical protein